MRTLREPRYRISPVSGFRRARIRNLLGGASVAAAGVVIGLGAAGGTYAYFDDSVMGESAIVTAGTAELEVQANFTAATWGNLLVGESVRQPFTIINRGDVPLTLTASGTTSTSGFELRSVMSSCPGGALGGASITQTPASIGSLAAGASTTACLEVRLVSGAPGVTSTVAVTISGTQVP